MWYLACRAEYFRRSSAPDPADPTYPVRFSLNLSSIEDRECAREAAHARWRTELRKDPTLSRPLLLWEESVPFGNNATDARE